MVITMWLKRSHYDGVKAAEHLSLGQRPLREQWVLQWLLLYQVMSPDTVYFLFLVVVWVYDF